MANEATLANPGEIPENVLSLDEIVGQAEAVQRLKALVDLARSQGRTLPHILLVGRPGSGKGTVAMALAKEMGVTPVACASASLSRGGDLLGILTNLGDGGVDPVSWTLQIARKCGRSGPWPSASGGRSRRSSRLRRCG